MKNSTTKGTKSNKSKAKTTGNKKSGGCCKNSSQQESEADPFGSYTGNPVGWGVGATPIQDVDDL